MIHMQILNKPYGAQLAGIYLFTVNIAAIRTICEISSELTVKTPKQCQWRHSAVFIVNFEQIPNTVQWFPLLTLNK